jgi:hypothetical protein
MSKMLLESIATDVAPGDFAFNIASGRYHA